MLSGSRDDNFVDGNTIAVPVSVKGSADIWVIDVGGAILIVGKTDGIKVLVAAALSLAIVVTSELMSASWLIDECIAKVGSEEDEEFTDELVSKAAAL